MSHLVFVKGAQWEPVGDMPSVMHPVLTPTPAGRGLQRAVPRPGRIPAHPGDTLLHTACQWVFQKYLIKDSDLNSHPKFLSDFPKDSKADANLPVFYHCDELESPS